jgi:all-trans-8'-apo-beta-carotenal 15,15'-oxygenase
VHGAEHARAYAVFGDLDRIGAIETTGPATGRVTAHELPAGELASEPLYADGYLLSLCHAKDRAFVAVYDTTRIPDGPVAKIWIDHHVPITFHGVYAPR